MSSNRRPSGRRPNRPDDDFVEARAPRRDPRRRTPYTPRQRSARPPEDDFVDDYLDEAPPERQQRTSRPRQSPPPANTQQRSRGQQSRAESYDDYSDDYLDDGYEDDRVIDTGRAPAGRSSRQQPARGSGRSRQADPYDVDEYAYDATESGYDDSFDDGFIDEDDWYEEEAAAGGYSPRQRSSRSVPKPSISVPRPTMPKVTLPRPSVPIAVRDAALIQDRNSLILAGVLVLSLIGMVVLTMTRIDQLAPGFSTHISASGVKEAFRTENALWQLPLMAGALLVMNLVLAWFLATWSTFSARFLLSTSIIVQVVIWIALVRIAL